MNYDIDEALFADYANITNREHCGILIGTRDSDAVHVTAIKELPNKADDITSSFRIMREDVVVDRDTIVGYWHTHDGDSLLASDHDVSSIPDGKIGAVYHTLGNRVTVYDNGGNIVTLPELDLQEEVTDWIDFLGPHPWYPDQEATWSLDATFLMSDWSCLYGNGCQGMYGIGDKHTVPDHGCCTKGAWFTNTEDMDRVAESVGMLTSEDWDDELRTLYKDDWYATFQLSKLDAEDPANVNARTRVFNGGCVFSNRHTGSVGSTGKTGCALGHMANRLGEDHIDRMPSVCSSLPLRLIPQGADCFLVQRWDRYNWYGKQEKRLPTDSFLHWWCVDYEGAYGSGVPVYRKMERELRRMMGDGAFDIAKRLLDERYPGVSRMPVHVNPEGKPTLPLFVGNRTPK